MIPARIYTPDIIEALKEVSMSQMGELDTALKIIGSIRHNNPPEPTPFEQSVQEIDDLYGESKNWCDGTPLSTQAHADAVSKLIEDLRNAARTADKRRVTENKPFDEGKKAVQARFHPLLDRATTAMSSLKGVLRPFLEAQEAEKRKDAQIARDLADAAHKAAQEAFQASDVTDLAERERAEVLLANAKFAEKDAARAEKDKAGASGGARKTTLRTTYRAEVTDLTAFSRYIWTDHKADLQEWLEQYAALLVRAGMRTIPGVIVHEEKVL